MGKLVGEQALQARLHAVGKPLGKTVTRKWALLTVRYAKQTVHRKTGNLGRSIHMASITDTNAVVEASASYARVVEFGSRAHEITPKAAKALRWAAPGGARLSGAPRSGAAVIFAKRVHHPGTKPYPYLIPAAKRATKDVGVGRLIVESWNGAA